MQRGEVIRVRAYGGEEIERRVVEVTGSTVYLCRDEEFQAAEGEGREPTCVGSSLEAGNP